MTSDRKPSAAFWATVVVVVALVAYPLSYGPAWWLYWHAPQRTEWMHAAFLNGYAPMGWALSNGPSALKDMHDSYMELWAHL